MIALSRITAIFVVAGWATGCCCCPPDLVEWYLDSQDAWYEASETWEEPPISPSDSMTPDQAKESLDWMNEICGDTLCEGAFDFRFDELECVDRTCTLGFRARHYTERKWRSDQVTFDVDGPVYGEFGDTADFSSATGEALDAWVAAQGG
jgi:hypothetical protein